ncbi:MAG TPA: hypothetical protein VNG71_17680 [Pyrinomonadaceae bacterium]|nr:hypothetical protein [Pyrinomonadaceae bacterium]
MSTSGRELLESFEHLSGSEKREVASEIIRRTLASKLNELDDAQLAALYAEFADDDRALAEEGFKDYERGLVGEDAR